MNTKFQIGQEVTAIHNVQGLRKGLQYKVVNVIVDDSILGGTYVRYLLVGEGCDDGLIDVGNAHVVLSAV